MHQNKLGTAPSFRRSSLSGPRSPGFSLPTAAEVENGEWAKLRFGAPPGLGGAGRIPPPWWCPEDRENSVRVTKDTLHYAGSAAI